MCLGPGLYLQGNVKSDVFGFISREPTGLLICHLLRCHSGTVVRFTQRFLTFENTVDFLSSDKQDEETS